MDQLRLLIKKKNVIFTGDGIGSGFVWLVWDNIDDCLAVIKKKLLN